MRYIIKQRIENGVITHVKIDLSDEKLGITDASKKQVIDSIKLGNKYKTKHNNLTADVYVVDDRYIRTDSNTTKEDNLGDLPLF